jgi:HAD superfamily hydrolase (TIGR01509 family)
MKSGPVILFDAMDTLVKDPFYTTYPSFFRMSLKDLLPLKNPAAWPEFERGNLEEEAYARISFLDGRVYDYEALKKEIRAGYQFLEGMENVLQELHAQELEMHLMSNYPIWYRMLDEKLKLTRYLPWTFVSCETGFRKPDPEAYGHVLQTLKRDPREMILVDDRLANCDAAQAAGLGAIHFQGVTALRASFSQRGLSF